jgi:hypothetical protein
MAVGEEINPHHKVKRFIIRKHKLSTRDHGFKSSVYKVELSGYHIALSPRQLQPTIPDALGRLH